ncbi:MAG: DUF6939 family protein [Cellulosilyticaceae bacterium]
MIYIVNKKTKDLTILNKYPNAFVIDVSSKGEQPWVKFSPFYPHGEIPIPPLKNNHSQYFSQTVEGIWQGLKVFDGADIDRSKFEIKNMEGIKRTVRKFGKPLGHRFGVNGTQLLDYPTARKEIYLRSYAWVLDNLLQNEILLLKEKAETQDLVLLDYNINEDIENYKTPLSHAGLVKRYLFQKYPELAVLSFTPSLGIKKRKIKKRDVNRMQKTLFD